MIKSGIASLEFEEPSLSARIPASLEVVASACWVGFRLLTGDTPAVENLIIGKKRLPQFRDAKRSELTRLTRYHFYAAKRPFEGDAMTVGQWRERWLSDPALRRIVIAHPAFLKWLVGLRDVFETLPIVAMAEEENRNCYGAIGGDRKILKAMHEYMEEGGIDE